MNREQLFAELCPGERQVVLRPEDATIRHLATSLREVTDANGWIVIEKVAPGARTRDDTLEFSGEVALFEATEPAPVRARFVLVNGVVDHFHLLISPPESWRFLRLLPSLSSLGVAGAPPGVLDVGRNALLVVCAGTGTITDDEFDLDAEPFDDGTSLYVTGLTTALPVPLHDLDDLPVDARSILRRPPDSIKITFDLKAPRPGIGALLWWTPPSSEVLALGGLRVPRIGISLGMPAVPADGMAAPEHCWLFELELQPGDRPLLCAVNMPAHEGEPPRFQVFFEGPRPLKDGLARVGSLVGGDDPSRTLPFTDAPAFALEALSFTPGREMAVQLDLVDGRTGVPYAWQAIEGVKLADATLFLSASLEAGTTWGVGVAGIATIGGYEFDVDVEVRPDHRVSGVLRRPNEVHLEGFIEDVFGAPIDLPGHQLQLQSANYHNDVGAKTVGYGVAVAGSVDLFGNGAFVLTDVGFQYESTDGKATCRRLTGSVTVAGVPVRLEAERDSEPGWFFEGRINPFFPLSLTHLADELMHSFDLALPPGLPDIALADFGLDFDSGSRLVHASGRAIWTAPDDLPWSAKGKDELYTVVDFRTVMNPETGTREAEVSLDWIHASGDANFEARASFARDGTSFYLTWDGGEKGTTLGLHSLHGLLNLDSLFQLPKDEGWTIFDFNRIVVGYQSSPWLLNLAAKSRLGTKEQPKGELTFDSTFETDRRSIAATWEAAGQTAGIDDLLAVVGWGSSNDLPGGLGKEAFEFNRFALDYELDAGGALRFVGAATHAFYKDAFVVVHKATTGQDSGKWGFAAGVSFAQGTRLGDIPVVKDIPDVEYLSIEPILLMVSTFDATRFLPPTSPGPAGAAGGSDSVTPGSVRLLRGATVAARIRFDDATGGIIGNLQKLIRARELDACVAVSTDRVGVVARIPGSVRIPTGVGGDLVLSDPFFSMEVVGPVTTFNVVGSTHFNVFGEPRLIEFALTVGEEAAVARARFVNVPLPCPGPLPGVHVKEDFWLEVGVQFEPEGLDMGFIGDFHIGDDETRYTGKAVFVLEMIEEVPNPLFVQFAIETLDLWAMFEAMTGTMSRLDDAGAALDSGAAEFLKHQYKNLQGLLDKIAFRNVTFHWADSVVILPDGTTATPGVGFRGTLDLFGWTTFGAFESSPAMPTRLSGRFEMTPVHLQHILSITGDGRGVLQSEASGEIGLDRTKRAGPMRSAAPKDVAYAVPPGGPVFVFSSQHSPFLHADIRVALFDVLHADVRADVDEHGLSFQLEGGAGRIVNMVLGCQLATKDGFRFEAHGKFGLHLEADIPIPLPVVPNFHIPLSAGLDAEIDLVITAKAFNCSIRGTFEFEHVELHMPELPINVPFGTLGALPAKILQHVIDNAEHIFADIVHGIEHLGEAAIHELGAAGKAIEGEVVAIGTGALEVAGEVTAKAEEAFDAAAAGAHKAVSVFEDAAAAMKSRAATEVAAIRADAEKAAAALEAEGALALEDAVDTASQTLQSVAQEVAKVDHEVEDLVNEAAADVQKIEREVTQKVRAVLDVANNVAQGVVKTAEALASGVRNVAKVTWDEAKAVTGKAAKLAGGAWHGVENAGSAIGSGLKSAFSWL